MRILYLTTSPPYPATNGLTIRSWSILRALAELGHQADLLTFCDAAYAQDIPAVLAAHCDKIRTVIYDEINLSRGAYWQRIRSLPLPLPFGATRYRCRAMQAAIAQMLDGGAYDVVFCDTIDSTINLPDRVTTPVIVNDHNAEHMILRRFMEHERHPAKLAYAALEYSKLRRWERSVCKRATHVLACSAIDRNALERLCEGATVSEVPNVIDLETYVPSPDPNGMTVLYTGGMDWYPNRDAVHFFATKIYPDLRKKMPQVRFVVAGRNPDPGFMREHQALNVEFTGSVPDMLPLLRAATVCVVPLRIGSGTRLKILEAAAMERPIVSTPLGAEGLTFQAPQEIALAATAREFSARIAELLGDPQKRRAMAIDARRRVEDEYSMPVLRRTLLKVLATFERTVRADNPIAAVQL